MGRFGFVLTRFAQAIPMLAGIVLVVFLLLHVAPGDPARNVAGPRASREEVAEIRTELGIDRPLVVQYGDYAGGVLRGDLGFSYKSGESVAAMVGARIGPTLWLLGAGLALTGVLTVPLAIVAARREGGVADHLIRFVCLLGLSLPSFWVGAMLLLAFALLLPWFPAGGFGESAWDHLRAVALPGLALAVASAPVLIRSLRASILSAYDQDYVDTARSLGLSDGTILRRFVLRNASSSTVTLVALEVGYLLFGAVVIESTFAIPGIGQGLVLAARGRDLPAIQGYTLLFAVAVVVVNLVADVVNTLLDPRVRIS